MIAEIIKLERVVNCFIRQNTFYQNVSYMSEINIEAKLKVYR